jgi:hypothetical protein
MTILLDESVVGPVFGLPPELSGEEREGMPVTVASFADAHAVLNGILAAAANSVSEEDLRIRCEPVFRDYLAAIGVPYEPRYEKVIASKGRLDALFGKVVTEYKKPNYLTTAPRVQRAFAQLQEYLETEARNTDDDVSRYAGILIDGYRVGFTRWRAGGWSKVDPEPLNVANVKLLLEHYRSLARKPLEPVGITRGLGASSTIAKDCIKALLHKLQRPSGKTKLLFAEWRRLFGQVSGYENYQVPEFDAVALAYGLANDADGLAKWLFATHTYFAVVIKLIAAEILTIYRGGLLESYVEKLALLTGRELREAFEWMEDDHVFGDYGIDNFLEGDFFSWYLDSWSPQIEEQFLALAVHLQEYEPATSILEPDEVRDLLKYLYQNLVPRVLRHDLGEFYTPDWLAEYVLQGIGYNGDTSKRLLDPNCGSGTFVVLSIRRAKDFAERHGAAPADTLRLILKNIVGFDLNPLAVIAARTNYLLALGDLLRHTTERIEIPVYLSDSIFSPARSEHGKSYEYYLNTEKNRIDMAIPSQIVEGGFVGKAMRALEQSVRNKWTPEQCLIRLKAEIPLPEDFWTDHGDSLIHVFKQVVRLEAVGWNRIWCRIIKNRYASASVGHFHYIAGNPAWVRWTRLPATYRETVKDICERYDIFSTDSWVGGIESDISTVLTYAAVDKWLRPDGRLGYVITQTVFKSKSSEGFRRFVLPDGTPLCVDSVDDMVTIKPFENAQNRSSVLFLTKGKETNYPVAYREWTKVRGGALSESASLGEIYKATRQVTLDAFPLAEGNNAWVTCPPEDSSAMRAMVGRSGYEGRKCVTSDLNNVYWVQFTGRHRGQLVEIENNLDAQAQRVKRFKGDVEAGVLFPLVRGRDIDAFHWERSDRYIIVPQNGINGFPEEMMAERYPLAAGYFARYRDKLERRSSYRRYHARALAPYYSLWNVGPYTFSSYKVVWREIGLPVKAAVIGPVSDVILGDCVAIADHKLMMVACRTASEAHYLCAIINSNQMRRLIGSFVIGTQVGARIFDFARIPSYDPNVTEHQRLAAVSAEYHDMDEVPDDQHREELDDLVRVLFA